MSYVTYIHLFENEQYENYDKKIDKKCMQDEEE